MVERHAPALDRAGRRRALRAGALAVGLLAAADLATSGASPLRAAAWGGWVGTYLVGAEVIALGPAWVMLLVSAITSLVPLPSLLTLASAGDGSRSLYFLVATMIPVMSVIYAPEDTASAALQGGAVLLGGVALQWLEGQGVARLVLYAVVVGSSTGAALHASLGQRRRLELHVREGEALLQREVELERERQRADRWASMGKLAEGVAHDVNSPLGSLRSNLAYVREEVGAGRGGAPEVDEALADSLEALERIRETVASLRAISVPEEAPEPPGGAPAQVVPEEETV
jgi:signal transduction histidine kinase